MPKPTILISSTALLGTLSFAAFAAGPATRPSAPATRPATRPALLAGKVDFVTQVKPVLEANCAKCHGVRPTKAYSMLTKKQAFTPGESEDPPIVPGKADDSLVIQLIRVGDPEHRMPQKAPPMKPETLALLVKWINEGAIWPDGVALTPPPEKEEK